MCVDQDRAQALDAVALDEAHAAHVRGQVVDLDRAFAGPHAIGVLAQVQAQAFDARHTLVPFGQRLLVDRPDVGETLVVEIAGQRAGDEAARAGDHDQIVLLQIGAGCRGQGCVHLGPPWVGLGKLSVLWVTGVMRNIS